jgi:hypothetical protein
VLELQIKEDKQSTQYQLLVLLEKTLIVKIKLVVIIRSSGYLT